MDLPGAGNFSVRRVRADQVSDRDIQAWSDLEARAIEPNAYLSPHFVCAAARYLPLRRVPFIFLVEHHGGSIPSMAGIAILTGVRPTWRKPIRRLTGHLVDHAFLDGILLDREYPVNALRALLDHLKSGGRYHAVELPLVWGDGPMKTIANSAMPASGIRCVIEKRYERPILRPALCSAQLQSTSLKRRVSELERRLRRLKEAGTVEWRWHRHDGIPPEAIERFLVLENMGWKGDRGTSLRAASEDERFFREMVAGFSSVRRALFFEMLFDGIVIASICNFVSGNAGFSFKIGWDTGFRKYSAGLLVNLGLMRNAEAAAADLEFIDSGSVPGSSLESLWPDRRDLVALSMPLSRGAYNTFRGVDLVRRIRNSTKSIFKV